MSEEGGVWRTIGGRRVFIKDGVDLATAMKMSGKFKVIRKEEKPKSLKDKILSSDKKRELDNKRYKQADEVEKKYNEDKEKLLKDLKENKITDEEWNRKDLDRWEQYNKELRDLRQMSIYDYKKDNFLNLDKTDVFKEKGKEYTEGQITNLTDSEKSAITDYTSQWSYGSYNSVNTLLYGEQTYGDKTKVKANIQELDNAMAKSKIGGEYQLYRGIEPSRINNEEIAKAITKINKAIEKGGINGGLEKNLDVIEKLKGTTIENKGFVSTSTYLDPNYMKRGVTLVINTKPEDRAIDIRSLSKYNGQQDKSYAAFTKGGIQTESEVLYDRDTNFKVKDIAITENGVFLLVDTEQKKK